MRLYIYMHECHMAACAIHELLLWVACADDRLPIGRTFFDAGKQAVPGRTNDDRGRRDSPELDQGKIPFAEQSHAEVGRGSGSVNPRRDGEGRERRSARLS